MSEVLERPPVEARTEAPADAAPAAPRAPHRRFVPDIAAKALTIHEGDKAEVVDLSALPPAVATDLMLAGAAAILQRAEDMAATVAEWHTGKVREVRAAKAKELDPWRLAYAHALVEEAKKSPEPLTLDAAKELARKLDRDGLTKVKGFPLVVKHHAKLTNAEPASLRSLVG